MWPFMCPRCCRPGVWLRWAHLLLPLQAAARGLQEGVGHLCSGPGTLPAQLPAPRLAGTTQNTVSLSWDPYEEIGSNAQFLHYEVRLESSQMEVSTRTTHVTEMLVGGLEPAETYAIKVRTVTTQGISPYSEALSVTTDGLTISKLEQLMDTLGILEMEVKNVCPL